MTREEERWTPPVPGGGAPRRRSVGRGVAAAALAAALAAGALRAGCARRGVSLSDLSVSERDVEVARQMGATEEALGAMEGGEWPSAGSRFMVRYAEMAQDHMLSRYGQPCRAEVARTPWMLEPRATVELVAEGGEHDGEAVTVTIDTSASPWAYADTWYWVELHEAYEREVLAAVGAALAGLPEGSWAAEAGMYQDSADWYVPGLSLHDRDSMPRGSVKIFLSPRAYEDGGFAAARVALREDLIALDMTVRYRLIFLEEVPEDGVVTVEFGNSKLSGDSFRQESEMLAVDYDNR